MKKARRIWSIVLFVALILQVLNFSSAASTTVQAAGEEYGLPATSRDGVILHAWNWSFDTITNNLPAIAAAGYKTVQTSPIQGTKENSMGGSYWWVLYQPTNFNIGNAQLGSRDQFKRMCEEAEKYGIKIIVDVILQHTANAGGGSLQFTPAYNVDPTIRNNSYFWHEARGIENYGDRRQVTQWGVGLPDLNTSNYDLQDKIISFLNDATSLGADGFRIDTAKHIELPNENSDHYGNFSSNFWPRVLGGLNNKHNLFIYGEVLQGGADEFYKYSNFIDLTASHYGGSIRHAVGYNSNKNVNGAREFNAAGVNPSKLVTFVETHDTYANDSSESTGMNEWHIKMGWAIIAARAQTTSLFFNRPAGGGKFAGSLGTKGNDLWKDPDVVAVNKFHNAMVGQDEYLRTQGNEIMLVERGSKGITIVNLGGDAYINSDTRLSNGTYINKATGGGTFTVSNGKITGNIGGGKIAVLYETTSSGPTVTIDKQEGGFYTDSLSVKIDVTNANNASYTVNNGSVTNFNSSTTVTLGAGAAFGTTFVLKVTANGSGTSTTKTYTFTKEDPNAALKIHYYKPSNWGTPNIYYYDDSVTPTKNGPAWPGVAMQAEGNGWYVATVPGWTKAKVIFNSNGNQIPGAEQSGYQVSGEKWIKDGVVHPNNPDNPIPTISIDKSEGVFNSDSFDITISYQGANSATYSLNGSAPISFTSGTKVTIGAGDADGTTYTLNVTAIGSTTNTTKTYTFKKQQSQGQLFTVKFYKPSNWGTPNIYYYDESVSPTKIGTIWPGVAMQDDGNGWYSYTISGWDKANVIFNSNGQQTPGSSQPGYFVNTNSWIKDGVITTEPPLDDNTVIPVTFNVRNATTAVGQNVYIVGSIAELGNWNPANAIGPGSTTNYPTWSFTIDLPVGTKIEFKAIKKHGDNVVWESGSDHSYTVSSSNPTVDFTFNN
ncbi:alpha-amylase [Fontibacillus panacisegetis]|uniref:Alpha-amylase n=1 Tax=Fontibacillus panacisegetis TaxID=670482 RepID=A0A1G7MX91_9BACL|nr:starch-binding protein [Fontibacillus panacisegetis]SDF66291.1 alpha-amylase [Fontibacillus panacisegetis]